MNIKETTDILINQHRCSLSHRSYNALHFKQHNENDEVSAHISAFFSKQQGRKGKLLSYIHYNVCPLFDSNRELLSGVRGKEFHRAKLLSKALSCTVNTIGVSVCTFENGIFKKAQ